MVIILATLIVGNGRSLMDLRGNLGGYLRSDQGEQRLAALQCARQRTHRIIVDNDQARYLFGYKIPPEVLAYEYAAPFPGDERD